ncbi:hypothetical protein [Kamptonema sp. UHCC 0994]|uniref:hypothetical protein n=1 Tax=Kamptonema sp. UHCC 0994 TaxID=3031329 RepID=UPI0023B9DACC|nr:hypothetical protein [Kamptonema sp. UHCC 0994]MDF0551810.1 hypothetical protein [Kamptonema sp. UHCC 0994]
MTLTENLEAINPKVAFADFTNQLSQPETILGKVTPQLPDFDEFKNKLNLPHLDLSNIESKISSVPLSANELKAEITEKFNQLTTLNLETLSAAIPLPSADTFKDLDLVVEVKSTLSSLTKDLSFNFSIGNLPPAANSIFGEFNEFLSKAEMLPVRTFNALLKVFQKLLEKLSNPDELLSQLGADSLTSIFNNQIVSLTQQLPSEAIKSIEANINLRRQYLVEYQEILNQLSDPSKLDQLLTKELRQKIRVISRNIEEIDRKNQRAIANLSSFTIESFNAALEQLSQVAESDESSLSLLPLFNQIQSYLDSINQKVADITAKLREFTKKIPQLIDTAINKAEELARKATTAIAQGIDKGKEVLIKIKDFLSDAIREIKEFIDKVCAESTELVKPLKQGCNQASTFIVGNIDRISGEIHKTTEQVRSAIGGVNSKIETNLNRQALELKINQLLDKVAQVLDSPQVNNGLKEAENGLKLITDNLEKVSLKPAFQAVVDKSGDLETKLRGIDTTKLSTPTKTALKVGTTIIKQVDVPGIVNPELKLAFAEILEPIEGIVGLIEGEFQKIDAQIQSFKPGSLIEEFIKPYLDPVVVKLNEYKPSILLQPVKDFYYEMLGKLDAIDPQQLIDKLEELYQNLVQIIESLSPTTITEFLNQQLQTVNTTLDNIPVEALVEKVNQGLDRVDKLMASVGLTDVLKSDFWVTLENILSYSFADKIKQIEGLRDRVVERVNAINTEQLTISVGGLEQAIIDYVETQKRPNIGFDLSSLQGIISEYNPVIIAVQERWEEKKLALTQFNPQPELAVEYQDLRDRLQKLYDNFSATNPQSVYENVEQLLRENIDRLKPAKSDRSELIKTFNSELIISSFKQALPVELDRQLINPIKNLLNSLDSLLAQPRSVLGDIKLVIQKLQEAPGRLAAILSNVATSLGNQIRDAINAVKAVVNSLVGEVVTALQETYNNVVSTVRSLSPHRLLNSFEDSDFIKFDNLLTKLQESNDSVSAYIKSQLTANTQSLLAINSPGTKTAVIRDLNRLLLDENLYTPERFKDVSLSAEAQKLSQGDYRNNIVHFNRVLIESNYSGELVMNVESIFPYLQSQLAQIYPQKIVDELDKLHANLVKLLNDILSAVGSALDGQYQEKIVKKTQALRDAVNNLFKGLKARLKQLQSELDIGLEDVAEAFDRLLNAIPV